MMIIHWLASALTFLVLPYIVPGIVVKSFGAALILALLWGLVNITIRPVLLILTLPLNLLTFGVFTFVINGFLLWILGGIIKGFEVRGFFAAIVGALVLSATHTITHWVLHTHKKKD